MSEEYIPSTTTTTDWCSRFCSRILPIDVAIFYSFFFSLLGWCLVGIPFWNVLRLYRAFLVCEKPHTYFLFVWRMELKRRTSKRIFSMGKRDEIIVVTCIIWGDFTMRSIYSSFVSWRQYGKVSTELRNMWRFFFDLGHRVDSNIEIDTLQTDV